MSDAARAMDAIYRGQRHIYDATRKFYLLGRDELIAGLAPPPGASLLEIGCGTGRNLVKMAQTYPDTRLFGLDVSHAMLETAAAAIVRARLPGRITLAAADATAFDAQTTFGRAAFDRIVISYALSMIPPWQNVLRHAATMLEPGGSLHIVDFGDQAGLPHAFKVLLERWLAAFHVKPRTTLPQEVEALGASPNLQSMTRPRFRGYAIEARIERR